MMGAGSHSRFQQEPEQSGQEGLWDCYRNFRSEPGRGGDRIDEAGMSPLSHSEYGKCAPRLFLWSGEGGVTALDFVLDLVNDGQL